MNKTAEVTRDVKYIGKIDMSIFEGEFGKLRTDEVVLTNERDIHIRERHPQDYAFFEKHAYEAVNTPDAIIVEGKHESTVFLVKNLPETNLNVVLRLALDKDRAGLMNSIMTFYRLRDSNLKKMLNKNKVLYKRE